MINYLFRAGVGLSLAWAFALHAVGQTVSNAPVQEIYRNGVPHTDKTGNYLSEYDPAKSFFPIALGWVRESADNSTTNLNWTSDIKAANFNTVWAWTASDQYDYAAAGAEHDLQVVPMYRTNDYVLQNEGHPNLLANFWFDEPTNRLNQPGFNMGQLQAEFEADLARHETPLFATDAGWITEPATDTFTYWATTGDVSSHDNYPFKAGGTNTIANSSNGIPQTVSFAVSANQEQKPLWFVAQSFEDTSNEGNFQFRYPDDTQLRTMIYTSIVHGATGITYFAQDSHVTRNGKQLGISPRMQTTYAAGDVAASPEQIAKGEVLWDAAVNINAEIQQLTPALLSPTASDLGYGVSLTQGSPYNATPVRTILKQHAYGGYVLIAVNTDNAFVEADLPFSRTLDSVVPMFTTPGVIESSIDTLQLDWSPFETKIFRIESPLPAVPTSDGAYYLERFNSNTPDNPKTSVIGTGASITDQAGQLVTTTPTEGVVRAGVGLNIPPTTEYVLEFDYTVNDASGDNFYALFSQGTSAPYSNDIAIRIFSDGTGDWEFQVDHGGSPNYTQSDLNFSFGEEVHFTVHHTADSDNLVNLYVDGVLFGQFVDRNPALGVDLIQWGDGSSGTGYGDATVDNIVIGAAVIALRGDFNDDGIVNLADYNVWRDNLGSDAAALNGKGSGAPTVVQADFELWKANLGKTAFFKASTAAVPEASCLTHVLVGCVVGGLLRLQTTHLN